MPQKKKVKPKIVVINGKKYIKIGNRKYRVVRTKGSKLSNNELIKYFIDKLLKKKRVTRRVKKTSNIALPSNPISASYFLQKAIQNEKDKNQSLNKAFDEYKKKQIEKNPGLKEALVPRNKRKPKVEPDSDEEELLNFGNDDKGRKIKGTPGFVEGFKKQAEKFAKQKEEEKKKLEQEKLANELKAMKAEVKAELNEMKVAELKELAKANGIKITKKNKADLIKDIYEKKKKELESEYLPNHTKVIIQELDQDLKEFKRRMKTPLKTERKLSFNTESKISKSQRDLYQEIREQHEDKQKEKNNALYSKRMNKIIRGLDKMSRKQENRKNRRTMKKVLDDSKNTPEDIMEQGGADMLASKEEKLMRRYGTSDLNEIAQIELKNSVQKQVEERKDDSTDFREQDGKGIKGIPLSTSDIDKIMRKYPSYLGTFARDEVKQLYKVVKPKKKAMFIFNTDTSDKEGKHWQAVFIDPVESKSVEFYDSFADPAPKSLLKDLKKIVDAMKPDTYFKFKENRIKQQSVNTANCGWFCIRFLIDRSRGKPFPEASGFSEVVKNEKNIEKFKSKFPEFNYI